MKFMIVNTEEWKGLTAIGMVKTKRIVDCSESVEYRYFITSFFLFRNLIQFSSANADKNIEYSYPSQLSFYTLSQRLRNLSK